jgi:hypothetical protein
MPYKPSDFELEHAQFVAVFNGRTWEGRIEGVRVRHKTKPELIVPGVPDIHVPSERMDETTVADLRRNALRLAARVCNKRNARDHSELTQAERTFQ